MRVTWLAACCAAAVGLAACGGGDDSPTGYPSDVRDNFMSACIKTGSEQVCRCVLDKLEETVPYDDFERADAEIKARGKASGATAARIERATDTCR